MTNRIPPSLNWLINTRARLAGELEKTKRSLANAKALINELEDIESKLQAIDVALGLHNIQIDVDLIKPIESKNYRLEIPYGELTKSILLCFRIYGENAPVSKTQIMNFVIARHYNDNSESLSRDQLGSSITNRLKNLFHDGVLNRHHDTKGSREGLWSLRLDNTDQF